VKGASVAYKTCGLLSVRLIADAPELKPFGAVSKGKRDTSALDAKRPALPIWKGRASKAPIARFNKTVDYALPAALTG
jgi:hypothetical protein